MMTYQNLDMMFPTLCAWICAAGLAVLAAVLVIKKPTFLQGMERSSATWLGIYALICVVCAASLTSKLYRGEAGPVFALLLMLALAALLLLARGPVLSFLAGLSDNARLALSIVRDVVLLILVATLSFLALELPWNDELPLKNINGFFFELALIGLVLFVLYLIAQRRGALSALGVFACAFIGIAQAYVVRFKGTTIKPGDLYSLGTAFTVAQQYDYSFGQEFVLAACCVVAALGLLSLIFPLSQAKELPREGKHSALQEVTTKRNFAIARIIAAAVLVAAMLTSFTACDLRNSFGIYMTYWNPLATVKSQGFLTGFLVGVKDLKIRVPIGYSEELALETQQKMVQTYDQQAQAKQSYLKAQDQFSQEKPSIVVVMNEAFSDLTDLGKERIHYEGPRFFSNADPPPLVTGELAVSVLGGGTCNTEFEFLTGISMAFVGSGKYPYSFYDLTRCPSVVRQLSDLGYETSAMHPNKAQNWDRDKAYESLGFERFYDITDFPEDAPSYHVGICDSVTYDKACELIENSDKPQFIFDVTMQGHGGYTLGSAPADYRAGIVPEGFSADDKAVAELNEYLDTIDHSDADLEQFIKRIAQLKKKVVVLFFGDHKPAFAKDFAEAYFTDDDPITLIERSYHSNYAIWANYDIAAQSYGSVQAECQAQTETQGSVNESADALSARLFELIGVPLTDFQKARLAASQDISLLNYYGYQDSDGIWHPIWDDEQEDDVDGSELVSKAAEAAQDSMYDLSLVEYLEFGSKY